MYSVTGRMLLIIITLVLTQSTFYSVNETINQYVSVSHILVS